MEAAPETERMSFASPCHSRSAAPWRRARGAREAAQDHRDGAGRGLPDLQRGQDGVRSAILGVIDGSTGKITLNYIIDIVVNMVVNIVVNHMVNMF